MKMWMQFNVMPKTHACRKSGVRIPVKEQLETTTALSQRAASGESRLDARSVVIRRSPRDQLLRMNMQRFITFYQIFRSRPQLTARRRKELLSKSSFSTLTAFPSVAALSAARVNAQYKMHCCRLWARRGAARQRTWLTASNLSGR